MILRRLTGGPYQASCVFDLLDPLTPHLRTLKTLTGHSSDVYIGELIAYAIWMAGKRINALDPKHSVPAPTAIPAVHLAVDDISRELEVVLYRTLTPLQYTPQGLMTLRPDRILYHRGEVWLCWKTRDLY